MPHLCRQDGLNQGQPLLPAVAQQLLKVGKCSRLRFSKCGAQGSGKKGTSAAHAARGGQGRLKTDCMDQPLQQAWGLIAALRLTRLPSPELGHPLYLTPSIPPAACQPRWRKRPPWTAAALPPGSCASGPPAPPAPAHQGPQTACRMSVGSLSPYRAAVGAWPHQSTHPRCSSWVRADNACPTHWRERRHFVLWWSG